MLVLATARRDAARSQITLSRLVVVYCMVYIVVISELDGYRSVTSYCMQVLVT